MRAYTPLQHIQISKVAGHGGSFYTLAELRWLEAKHPDLGRYLDETFKPQQQEGSRS